MVELIVISLIGFVVSVASGILGLGGAVILIPAYLYLPPLLGLPPIDIKTITGLTSLQVFASSLLGVIIHKKHGGVAPALLYIIGIPMTIAALAGALLSSFIDGKIILIIFAAMAVFGAFLMFTKYDKKKDSIEANEISFNKILAFLIAVFVGLFGGMVGAPGAFLLAPLMISVLKIPTRITIGSTLGIVLFTSFSASVGKIIAGQVDFLITAFAVVGSLAGVTIGSNLSYKFNPKFLRLSLAVIIIGIAIQMVLAIFLP